MALDPTDYRSDNSLDERDCWEFANNSQSLSSDDESDDVPRWCREEQLKEQQEQRQQRSKSAGGVSKELEVEKRGASHELENRRGRRSPTDLHGDKSSEGGENLEEVKNLLYKLCKKVDRNEKILMELQQQSAQRYLAAN